MKRSDSRYIQQYYRQHKLDIWQQRRIKYAKLRKDAILKLGGVCQRCGFSDHRALQIDHIRGNGAVERRAMTNYKIYQKIVAGESQHNYQLLCANCNWIKRYEKQEYLPYDNSR